MSQQQEVPLPPHEGDQLNWVPPVGGIQADEIIATNVANVQYIGTQHITVLREPSQQRKPPLQRPYTGRFFAEKKVRGKERKEEQGL